MSEDGGSDLRQCLVRLHQIQIDIGFDAEQIQYLVEHFAVLGCGADERLDARGAGQALYDGGHLDGFGPRADDGEDSEFG